MEILEKTEDFECKVEFWFLIELVNLITFLFFFQNWRLILDIGFSVMFDRLRLLQVKD